MPRQVLQGEDTSNFLSIILTGENAIHQTQRHRQGTAIANMPTLITELTPLQRMWLYENQLTRGGSGDSYEERWTRMGTSYSSEIFRERQLPELEPPPPEPRMRKRRYEDEFCIHISPRHVRHRHDDDEASAAGAVHAPPPRHQAHNRGPNFPFHGDKLTWHQSLENLKVYRDHYGVRLDCRAIRLA
jgi:hypothetical protein